MPDPVDLVAALEAVLRLPRAAQPAGVRDLRDRLPTSADEPWNSAFGDRSLYQAFARGTVAQGVHQANRAVLRRLLDARPQFRVVEVGGGDGSLWRGLLGPADVGEIVVVDPHADGALGVRAHVPPGVQVHHVQAPVQDVQLPEADAVVCSLVLHHVAGADAGQRASVALPGPGKLEVLGAFRASVQARDGRVLLNEADVYCDIGLLPGDPLLTERLLDSYVRRCATSLAADIATRRDVEPGVRARWGTIIRDWCLGQVDLAANAPIAERDVYELDVLSWLALLDRAGLEVESRTFTDPWLLFHQYVLSAR